MKVVEGYPYVTAEEMGVIDRAAIEEYGVGLLSLMENAGVAAASVAKKMLGGTVKGKRVAVLAGKGNNGGDGLVAARHLNNWGADVRILLSEREGMREAPLVQLRAIEKTGVRIEGPGAQLRDSDVLIDALLGYNSKGNPREPLATIVVEANETHVPILAVDIPSGLDATSGEPGDPCIVARATVAMGFLKTGFLNPKAGRFVGEMWLGDVSLPAELYRRYSQLAGVFEKESVVKID